MDPESVAAYTSSRLVPLDKNPGVRPVGIGEIVRRIVGKAALLVISLDLRRVAGSDQLCVGQRAGIESAHHDLRDSFTASDEQCLLQIDADHQPRRRANWTRVGGLVVAIRQQVQAPRC